MRQEFLGSLRGLSKGKPDIMNMGVFQFIQNHDELIESFTKFYRRSTKKNEKGTIPDNSMNIFSFDRIELYLFLLIIYEFIKY